MKMRSLRKIKRALLPALLCAAAWAIPGIARADTAQFDAANRLYEAGKFDQAAHAYDQMIRTGPLSANLFYNRGNAQWKLGNAGKAIADYERALALEPSHPQARANLDFAREQTGAKTSVREWWINALAALAPGAATMLLSVSGWVSLFCLAIVLLRRENRLGPVVAMIFALCAAAYAGGSLWEAGTEAAKAVVIAKSVEARVADAESAPVVDTLPAGSEVLSLTNHDDGWTYCTLPDGRQAWVPTDALEKVKPA